MSAFVSLLDGRFAKEWTPYLGNSRIAFVATPSTAVKPEDHRHFCGCGREQTYCAPCDVWVCDAPGHIKHACRKSEGDQNASASLQDPLFRAIPPSKALIRTTSATTRSSIAISPSEADQ